jgi:glycine/D-amino acid oxidase-like deaminating enzyme
MIKTFDVIAIGTGSAASAVASRCREAGWQVAIVDSRPFGGTCALLIRRVQSTASAAPTSTFFGSHPRKEKEFRLRSFRLIGPS